MKKLLFFLFLLPSLFTYSQVIVTAVGGGSVLGDGGPASAAELSSPYGIALDDSGNLYICDALRIRKVSPGYGGIITTIAGNGTFGYSGDGGLGIYAQISAATDVFVDRIGNVYIADEGNYCIRKVSPSDTITTIAGTGTSGYNGDGIPATAAQLSNVSGVTVDSIGNVYIADGLNHRIRKVDTAGIITTIAGTGIAGFSPDGSMADTAKLDVPFSIRVDKTGNLFFYDSARIRKINTAGILSTVAGNGVQGFSGDSGLAVEAEIAGGWVALDSADNLLIADGVNNRVREVTAAGGTINTVAGDGITGFSGDGGPPLLAEFRSADGLVVDDAGDIYISDNGNNRIRLVTKYPLSVSNVLNQEQDISVYPNPCHDYCTIRLNDLVNELADVAINDVTGQEVYTFKMLTNQPFTIHLDLPAGVYIIRAITAQQQFNQKLIIQ